MKAELHIDGMRGDSCAALINFDENVVQQKTLVRKLQDIGYNATEGDQQQGATNNG
ncbi:MAG TPA: hypothetical protein VF297_26000 [Pyrinomonadaceae bacterium]